jgi:hypothetical protein
MAGFGVGLSFAPLRSGQGDHLEHGVVIQQLYKALAHAACCSQHDDWDSFFHRILFFQ